MERSELFEWVKETYGTALIIPGMTGTQFFVTLKVKNGMPLSWKYLFKNWG